MPRAVRNSWSNGKVMGKMKGAGNQSRTSNTQVKSSPTGTSDKMRNPSHSPKTKNIQIDKTNNSKRSPHQIYCRTIDVRQRNHHALSVTTTEWTDGRPDDPSSFAIYLLFLFFCGQT